MRITMSKFKDKFHLSPEQSLIFAKKRMDENIYCGMKMENRAVTFPQTQTILNGVNVPNVQLDDIQAILNMRDAWKFLLNTVNEEVTFDYSKTAGFISAEEVKNMKAGVECAKEVLTSRTGALEWGKLRTGTVGISGTDYEPPVPEKEKTIEELKNILNDANASATDKALEAFTWGARGQFFWDGNKRTSLLLANKILVSSGAGIMTITDKYMEQFNSLLFEYYNTGENRELKQFLYGNAILGLTI